MVVDVDVDLDVDGMCVSVRLKSLSAFYCFQIEIDSTCDGALCDAY